MKKQYNTNIIQPLDLHRKITANMTSESWKHAPHVSAVFRTEATRLLEVLKEINSKLGEDGAVTINTAVLKIIAEGLAACPRLNSHIYYNERLTRGKLITFDHVDITMPFMHDPQTTITLTIHSVEEKSLTEIRDDISDVIRRARNSNLQQAMYDVSIQDCMKELKRLRIFKVLGRLIGFRLDRGHKTLLHGAAKRRYKKLPVSERLTPYDLEQGTVTVSNIGALYRGWDVECKLLEIVPPQVVAIAINPVQDQIYTDADGGIRAGKALVLTIAHDHRALNGADFIPFFKRIEEIMKEPDILKEWI